MDEGLEVTRMNKVNSQECEQGLVPYRAFLQQGDKVDKNSYYGVPVECYKISGKTKHN